MTTEEIRNTLAFLKQAYPGSFRDMTAEDARNTIRLWKTFFENEDANIVSAAVIALIGSRKEGFTPTIGEICEKIREIRSPNTLSEQDAWALVAKACRNGSYGYKEEYEKLPPIVQEVVGAPEQLKAWALVDIDELETVTASNFRKSYRARIQRQEELMRIPESIRKKLEQYSGDETKLLKAVE